MAEFFDNLKREVGKGVNTVTVKSREALETSRLNSQIADLQRKKKEDLEELGNIVYAMHRKGAFDEERLRGRSAAIANMDDQIKQKETELSELHAQAQEALGHPKPVAVCECGAELHAGAKFCGRCGKKTEPNSSA